MITASPASLKMLASHLDQVDAFYKAGGTLLLNGLTPEGLSDYDTLVGFEHMIRPFWRERVTLSSVKYPLTASLTLADLLMYSSERIFPWQEGNYVSSEIF